MKMLNIYHANRRSGFLYFTKEIYSELGENLIVADSGISEVGTLYETLIPSLS